MKPIVNLEETPGKVVGKIRERSPVEAVAWMVRQFESLGLTLPYPRGVHRFRTFEEADEWQTKHQISAAARRLRESQR